MYAGEFKNKFYIAEILLISVFLIFIFFIFFLADSNFSHFLLKFLQFRQLLAKCNQPNLFQTLKDLISLVET